MNVNVTQLKQQAAKHELSRKDAKNIRLTALQRLHNNFPLA